MSSTDLLHAGASCNHPSCRTIDFLPFKCSHCTKAFCNEHWQPTAHECAAYDPAQYDRVVPQCPFCSKPVNVKPRQDVNEAMELHIDNDCVIFVGKKKRGPVCGNKKCGRSLISPIVCETCKGQFCPTHRMPDSHTCVQSQPVSTPTPVKTPAAGQSPSGIAAMKRAAQATTTAFASKSNSGTNNSIFASSTNATVSSSASSSKPKPVAGLIKEIKTDRCELSSSPVIAKSPTIIRTNVSNPFASNNTDTIIQRINTLTINTRSTNNPTKLSPIDRPRNMIPDPSKKWTPAALFV